MWRCHSFIAAKQYGGDNFTLLGREWMVLCLNLYLLMRLSNVKLWKIKYDVD